LVQSIFCEQLPLRMLCSHLANFEEGVDACVPQGSGPTAVEAQQQSRSLGSQMDLTEGLEMGLALSLPSPSALIEAPMLQLSSSEELDIVSIKAGDVDRLILQPMKSWWRLCLATLPDLTLNGQLKSRTSFPRTNWTNSSCPPHKHSLRIGPATFFPISTPRCQDLARNWPPIVFIVPKHLTIHWYLATKGTVMGRCLRWKRC